MASCVRSASRDTSNFVILRYGSDELKRKLVPRLLSQDPAAMWKGTQFMTEKSGGSDVGALESEARQDNGEWRLYGEKWFCSHTDADLALVLARPQGAATGTRGLGLFAMPRRLEDGSRNRYRIVRLKDKLGTRSMASGEIRLEGAFAWQVGELRAGFKQMLDQVNLSRLSHGVRAAAMMRRCLNEALLRGSQPRRFRPHAHRDAARAPPVTETDGADRAGALDVCLDGRRDGPRQSRR